jgi:putative FmdB family regulatory protein
VPIYDYRCTVCGREVEVVHGIHDRGPAECASCGGAMRKALSTPAIHFRGGGWAKKDAQTASASRSGGADTSTASGTATSDAGSVGGGDAPTDPASKGKKDGSSAQGASDRSSTAAGSASKAPAASASD